MSKTSTLFVCSNCDAQAPKWSGRCLECGTWGSLKETVQSTRSNKPSAQALSSASADLQSLADIDSSQAPRVSTAISELDTVLGGGLVSGSLILLGGEPGIGKSTLSLQLLEQLSKQHSPLYVSGEESGQQIKLRADRLGIDAKQIHFLSQTNVETIAATIVKHKPSLAIVDSIQTIYSNDVESEPGNISQVRACTVKLLEAAKSTNTPIVLIGHVTKGGQVAGPKTLEHLVDTVLYLEGDRYHAFRILRTVKNRFGPTNEVGVFEMTQKGLIGVENPSALFIEKSQDVPGSVITCILEGSRPFLIEVQALVTKSVYAAPQRRASGYDVNRLQLLLAVLQQRTTYDFSGMDVHINIVGGMKIKDPATDYAICQALISAKDDQLIPSDAIYLGEIGLAGEMRPVKQLQLRLKEAEKLGYKTAYIPKQKISSNMTIEQVKGL